MTLTPFRSGFQTNLNSVHVQVVPLLQHQQVSPFSKL